MCKMQYAGLQKNSTVDFPGHLCAVLFCPGCNYHCFYCHNRALLQDPPLLRIQEVHTFLTKRAHLLDGVVFSGGEATLQPELCREMSFAKSLGYRVKLDTNGSRPDVLRRVLEKGLADYIALDLKAPPEQYEVLCGQSAQSVFHSFELLTQYGVPFEVRTTVIPTLRLCELRAMRCKLPPNVPWYLQEYHPQAGDETFLQELSPYTRTELNALAQALSGNSHAVFVR